jgi:uncharacterized protein
MKIAVSFACGVVFALGLGISGMLQPAKVIGVLDVAGKWDPSLLFVMGPAVGVMLVAWRLRRGKVTPFGCEIPARASNDLDARLFIGAGLFGIGWAMTGVCPGPAVTNLAAPSTFTLVALGSMLAGIALSFVPIFRRSS